MGAERRSREGCSEPSFGLSHQHTAVTKDIGANSGRFERGQGWSGGLHAVGFVDL